MSRAALRRQEGGVKERERLAEELFEEALEAGRNNRAKNLLPLWGSDDSFHFNPMLLQNIVHSEYFQKCCRDLHDWNTIVDEIYYQAKHLEPFSAGSKTQPSTAFCLLLRLLTLRCTEKQMQLLLDHVDSPYIRGIGFLYLRYTGQPQDIWKWVEPYLYDEEQIQVSANAIKSSRTGATTTVGQYVRSLFSKQEYYGTMLPRFPIQSERDLKAKLWLAEKIEERAQRNINNFKTMEHFQKLNSKVMALYGDEENPITWYEAIVDRVLHSDPETGHKFKYPKFIVTFPEYGNTETVHLGEMEMLGAPLDYPARLNDSGRAGQRDHTRSASAGREGSYENDRGYSGRRHDERGGRSDGRDSGRRYERNSDRGHDRDRDRGRASSGGRNEFDRRPSSPNRSRSDRGDDHDGYNRTSRPYDGETRRSTHHDQLEERSHRQSSSHTAPETKRTAEELVAIQTKKRKMLAKYG